MNVNFRTMIATIENDENSNKGILRQIQSNSIIYWKLIYSKTSIIDLKKHLYRRKILKILHTFL